MSELESKSEAVLLDINGVGRLLGLSYWQVYGMVKDRTLPVVEIRKKFYFRRATIMRWLEKNESKVAA